VPPFFLYIWAFQVYFKLYIACSETVYIITLCVFASLFVFLPHLKSSLQNTSFFFKLVIGGDVVVPVLLYRMNNFPLYICITPRDTVFVIVDVGSVML
jgi:hypothetical protein